MSNFNLIQLNPLISSQWDEAILNSSSPQFFHLSSWIRTIADTYKFQPFCFLILSDQRCTIPMIIVKTLTGKKKAVALPFSDRCDIQTEVNQGELVLRLLSIAKEEKIDRLEFRGTTQFNPPGEPSHTYFGHVLRLTPDVKQLWKNLSSSKQRNIRKAHRESINITFQNNYESVREFYRLHCITRKRHGLPPQPMAFFDKIYENILKNGSGEIALAYSEDNIIAGALFLFFKTEALFKFGASNKELQNVRANDLLLWEAISRYALKKIEKFSFGKTEKYHEGLSRFKESFGASRELLNDHIYDVKSGRKLVNSPKVHGFHNKIFQKMPVPILRLCGELFYRYSS